MGVHLTPLDTKSVLEGKEKVLISEEEFYPWKNILYKILGIETLRPLLIGIDENLDGLIDLVSKKVDDPAVRTVDVTERVKNFLKKVAKTLNIDPVTINIEISPSYDCDEMGTVIFRIPEDSGNAVFKTGQLHNITEDLTIEIRKKGE